MVRDDLDKLVRAGRQGADPLGDACVKDRAPTLGKLTVGDIADEDVLERVFPLAGHRRRHCGAHEIAALQLAQPVRDVAPGPVQIRDRAWPEHGADDGTVLRHALLEPGEQIEARRDQPVQALRDRHVRGIDVEGVLLAQHPHQLLEEKRVAPAVPEYRFPGRAAQSRW